MSADQLFLHSLQGLNPLMFMFALFGNFTYIGRFALFGVTYALFGVMFMTSAVSENIWGRTSFLLCAHWMRMLVWILNSWQVLIDEVC